MVVLFLVFLKEYSHYSPQWLHQLTFPPMVQEVSPFSTPSLGFASTFFSKTGIFSTHVRNSEEHSRDQHSWCHVSPPHAGSFTHHRFCTISAMFNVHKPNTTHHSCQKHTCSSVVTLGWVRIRNIAINSRKLSVSLSWLYGIDNLLFLNCVPRILYI